MDLQLCLLKVFVFLGRRNFIQQNIYILTTSIVSLADGISITISIHYTCTARAVSFTYIVSITIIVDCTCTCLIIRKVYYGLVVVSFKSFCLIIIYRRHFVIQNISIRTTCIVRLTDGISITVIIRCASTCSNIIDVQ